jgi:hypothetical protein
MFVKKLISGLKKIIIFLRDTLGLTDLLTCVRGLIISLYCWILTPILFRHFDGLVAVIIMFVFTIIVTAIFLKISFGKTGRSTLLWLVDLFYKKSKPYITGTLLFVFEPFLFLVHYRDNYYQYNNTLGGKILLSLILVTSSLVSSIIWATFIYFSGIRI